MSLECLHQGERGLSQTLPVPMSQGGSDEIPDMVAASTLIRKVIGSLNDVAYSGCLCDPSKGVVTMESVGWCVVGSESTQPDVYLTYMTNVITPTALGERKIGWSQ